MNGWDRLHGNILDNMRRTHRGPNSEEPWTDQQWEGLLAEAQDEREFRIVRMRRDGCTMRQIAASIGCTHQRVDQLWFDIKARAFGGDTRRELLRG